MPCNVIVNCFEGRQRAYQCGAAMRITFSGSADRGCCGENKIYKLCV
jgi:hypothetical protein